MCPIEERRVTKRRKRRGKKRAKRECVSNPVLIWEEECGGG